MSTSIHKFDLSVIKQVVSRELSREGQVFFLHNTVRTIEQMANELRALFKGAVVKVAHGQMHKKDLEQAMLDFVMRKTDILVCSTIIESGIDVSNANTIVINDADRLGLAQLHQLRGRVGRFKRKAYAEMLIPADRPIKPIAARRLKAIEEYSELGAGFKIALQDLEIRGAGNLLGSQQSGHIDTVGYELYCKMLTNAVQDLSNEPSQRYVETVMDLGFTTYIPKSYIPSDKQRLGAYRKAAEAATIDDIIMLSKEPRDIFGKLPEEVEVLMDVSKVRICASQAGIAYIKANSPDLIFTFEKKFDNSKAIDLFAKIDRRITVADPRNVHIRLTKNHFEPKTILAFLRKMFKLYQ